MGWLARLREKRAIAKMALWGRGDEDLGTEVHAGVSVSQSNALQLVVVYACVRLLSESIASLPADAFRKAGMDGQDRELVPRQPTWLSSPNPETTWFEFCERVMSSLSIDGNAFILITSRDALGFPNELWTLNPRAIEVKGGGGRTGFVWEGSTPLSRFGPTTPGGDVLHIKAFNNGGPRGLSPIDTARQAIGLAVVAEKFGARFFGRGQTLSGVIELPANSQAMTDEAARRIKEDWKKKHSGSDRSFEPGILYGGATWKALSISPEDAQFLETRKFQVAEIARLFRVPPHLIGDVERTTSWGTGIEQLSIGFVRYSLLPWMVRLEQAFSQLLARGQFVKFNVKGLLRADPKAESEAFAKAVQNGWMTQAEIRQLLELPRRDGTDRFWMPSNLQPVTGLSQSTPVMPEDQGDADAGAS